jgi:hypothetical protein
MLVAMIPKRRVSWLNRCTKGFDDRNHLSRSDFGGS